jgi:hypothetical protein
MKKKMVLHLHFSFRGPQKIAVTMALATARSYFRGAVEILAAGSIAVGAVSGAAAGVAEVRRQRMAAQTSGGPRQSFAERSQTVLSYSVAWAAACAWATQSCAEAAARTAYYALKNDGKDQVQTTIHLKYDRSRLAVVVETNGAHMSVPPPVTNDNAVESTSDDNDELESGWETGPR